MSSELRILLLEDAPLDAELIESDLRKARLGFELLRVESQEDYLRAIHEFRPDIILSDYNLPSFDALAALRLLRENHLNIPFLLVTGSQTEEVAVECMRQGADDYILKNSLARLPSAVLGTLQKRSMEREREKAVSALRESEENFKAFMNHSPAVALMKDDAGRFLYANERWENQFTVRRRDWLGKTDFDFWPKETAETFRRSDLTVLATGKSMELAESGLTATGEMRHWHTYKFLVFDEAGRRVVGVIAMDTTEQKRLELQLRQAQKMEAVGQLAAGVAHDFNNLLTVIQGHASLLLTTAELPESTRESLHEIAQASDRAANLTRQLLTFSRKQPVQLKTVQLNDLVANLTRMLHRILGEDIALQCNYHPGLPAVHADAGMMEQIIMNLVVNARDAMPNGGQLMIASAVVKVGADARHPDASPGEFVQMSVTDTGTGMDGETLSHIFEPFFTTKDAGKGTGLGLATVYGIARQHGGWVEVGSQPGAGTVFKVFLPAVPNAAKTKDFETEEFKPRGGSETILLVEDEPLVRGMVRQVLTGFGYTVLEAHSGRHALQMWEEHGKSVDLVLTDMVMPDGVSGRELAERLLASNRDLKIIYTSGYSVDLACKGFALQDGVNFLQKPFRIQTLVHTLRNRLDN
jgi:two-component system cell cycle sensor histidine kinase/response regulator CckA